MSLDQRDKKMMCVSIPVVDWWDIQEEIDGLHDSVERLERIVKELVNLYHQERVKDWTMILNQMMKDKDRKNERFKTKC